MPEIKLETARLQLREINESHAAFVLELLNQPAFHRNIGDRGVRTIDDATHYIRERFMSAYARDGFGTWLVETKDSATPIGTCGLIKRDTLTDIDLGFSFLERYWSRGYALESARAMMDYGWKVARLPRLVAIVAPHNAPSIRLLHKLGFAHQKMIRLTPEDPEVMLFAIEHRTFSAGRPSGTE